MILSYKNYITSDTSLAEIKAFGKELKKELGVTLSPSDLLDGDTSKKVYRFKQNLLTTRQLLDRDVSIISLRDMFFFGIKIKNKESEISFMFYVNKNSYYSPLEYIEEAKTQGCSLNVRRNIPKGTKIGQKVFLIHQYNLDCNPVFSMERQYGFIFGYFFIERIEVITQDEEVPENISRSIEDLDLDPNLVKMIPLKKAVLEPRKLFGHRRGVGNVYFCSDNFITLKKEIIYHRKFFRGFLKTTRKILP